MACQAGEKAGFAFGQKLLDVGCGPGHATFDLARLVGSKGKIVAIDRSERFLNYLTEQITARGTANISTHLSDVEKLKLPPSSFDGAYMRWVLCFVKNPQAVINGVRRALKPGAPFVIQDYFHYEGVVIAPEREIFRRIFAATAKSWRAHGGNPNIGCALPELLVRGGFAIQEIRPIVRIARPGSPLWHWPVSFFANYLDPLVANGFISAAEKAEFEREWKKHSENSAAFFSTPPVVEIIAVRK